SSQQAVEVQRVSGLGPLTTPEKLTTTTTASVAKMWPAPHAPPEQEASSADLARLVEQGGLPLASVESLEYFVGHIGSYTYAVAYASDLPYTYARSSTQSGTQLTIL